MGKPELSPRVIREINEGSPIPFSVEDGEFYATRAINLCKLRQDIDGGNFPLTHYSSGEVIKRWVNKEGEVVKEDYAELPIYPQRTGRDKGLRRGVVHAIFGVSNLMNEVGAGDLMHDILVWDSTMPGGNPKLYTDEKCEGI